MQIPPRDGEGDRSPKASGGGVFATTRPTIDFARRERRSGNLPEVLLWRALRTRPGNFKFRRQHPVARYALDFACLEARLAIEVDGEAHDRGDRPARDKERDAALTRFGFRTIRLSAKLVLTDLDAAVRAITVACAARPLHPPPSASGRLPRPGEVSGSTL